MFNFMMDVGNYDDRKVDRYEEGDVVVSTVRCSDGQKPFETAVARPEYNDGDMVVVEMYDTEADAQVGHCNWVKAMTSDNLPDYLRDCGNAGLSQIIDLVCGEEAMIFPRQQE